MTKAIAQTYNAVFEYRMRIAYALIASCLVLIFIYGINVYRVVSATIALQRLETSSATLDNSVASLDSQYLALSAQITPDAIQQYGLVSGQVSEYIPSDSTVGSVALGGHEL